MRLDRQQLPEIRKVLGRATSFINSWSQLLKIKHQVPQRKNPHAAKAERDIMNLVIIIT
jgi:hypothetical protein